MNNMARKIEKMLLLIALLPRKTQSSNIQWKKSWSKAAPVGKAKVNVILKKSVILLYSRRGFLYSASSLNGGLLERGDYQRGGINISTSF